MSSDERCEIFLLFHGELFLSNGIRAFLYLLALAYCFIGLSAITARFFRSMENIVKHTRQVVEKDPCTNSELIKYEKVWNYTIADITLLAFGTSFPQISLATIDAIRNLGQLNAGGLGPGTLVGSAAFDLFPIHAVCVVVPKAGSLKKISDIGVWLVELWWSFWAYIWLYIILEIWTPNAITVWEAMLTVVQFGLLLLHAYAQDKRWPYVSLPLERSERPEDWVPEINYVLKHGDNECNECCEVLQVGEGQDRNIVDIFSIHSDKDTGKCLAGPVYHKVPGGDMAETSATETPRNIDAENLNVLSIWRQQFVDAVMVYLSPHQDQSKWCELSIGVVPVHLQAAGVFGKNKLESTESKKMNSLLTIEFVWQLMLAPWRLLFAFVPPYQIAHGWIAFICSLIFISGIAYGVTKITDLISCVTGINGYVIAFTALASGTSWPDLVASKIAAERQITADSAIANITCSNSVNIYIGIGIPWLIDTAYNFFAYNEPLYIQNAEGLSFSLLVFFVTSAGCIAVLVLRRLILGAELGGPRLWAWATSAYFMLLWIIFVVLSSLKVSGKI